MAFPSVRSATGGSSSNGTSPAFSLPATISAGDLIIVFAGTDSSATLTVPAGFTAITQDNAGSFMSHIFAKVASGSEGGTSPTGTLSGTESSCHVAYAIQDWSGNLSDVQASTIAAGGSTDQADPASVTASWGSDDNLFIAAAIADYWNQTATAWPTGYTGNQTTQQHQDEFSGTQGVSVATRELASASDDPSAFTLATTSNQTNAAYTVVVKPAAAFGPTLDTVPSTAYPGQSRTVTGTGFGATQGTGGITIGGVTQTITAWSDTSVTFTAVLGANSYGTGKTVELTTDDDTTDTGTIELVADTASGFGVVTMSDPNTTDESSVAFGATPTVVTGDQFEWEDFNALGNLVIDAAGFVSSVDTAGVFRGRFWDATDGTWGSVNTFTASTVDETAPTISSASVPTAGDNIAVQIDEPMQVGAGGSGGWTISLGGVSVTTAAVDGSDDTIVNLTPSRTITDEDTFTIGYTQPGDGFQDQADTPNDLATLSGQAVTNNSTQEPPDVTGPVIQSVGVPTAGTYAIGDDLSFTVNWNEAVTVTGTPALNLDIGGSSRQANYASGSGAAALVFTYTVQEGDEDTDGIAVPSLTLDGGTLQDGSGNNATLTLNSVGDPSVVLVDGIRPVISINPLTTTDTTPILTGSAGDATSLTLVVNSVTYNPTPSGGTWSQQLPELALDTYPVTLNGVDANGNEAVEAQAVLSVVDEIAGTNSILQPVLRSILSPIFEDVL